MRRLILAVAAAASLSGFALADPAAPACALLTPDVAKAWGQAAPQMTDGGAEQYGMSTCTWIGADNAMLVVTLIGGESITAFGGGAAAFDQYAKSLGAGGGGTPEAIEGLGEKATLILQKAGTIESAVVLVLKAERLGAISIAITNRDQALAVATAVAAGL